MHLTTSLKGSIMQNTQEKADLQKMKVHAMKTRKVRADKNKIHTGNEERSYTQQFRW